MAKGMSKQDRQWQAQDDLRTLISADAVKADKTRFAAAQSESKKQQKALQKVAKKPVAKKTRKGKNR